MTSYYVCSSLVDGATGPSNLRECACGTQVLVAVGDDGSGRLG
ncbi:MAG: hypothetical protein ACRDQZ_14845 [Mycobacteriales bacterium]